jgi:CHASE3 domain sensor protein
MKRRAGRIFATLLFVTIAGTATHQALMRSTAATAARGRLATASHTAAGIDLALIEAAASQRGYLAPGQRLDYWAQKVEQSVADARRGLAAVAAVSGDGAVAAATASAASRLDDFLAVDEQARRHAGEGRASTAADIIFADGYEIVAAARADAAAAVLAARGAMEGPLRRDEQVHLASIGILALCGLAGALLLLRGPRSQTAAPVALSDPIPASAMAPSTGQDDSIGAALDASLAGLDDFSPAAPPASVAPAQAVDLSSAADVCVDLARLLDARDLPAVLARAAAILGAQGAIVWLAQSDRLFLTPALTHGYAPSLMARVGALSVDADNATAAAWRASSLQVVDGAMAVPLLTSSGCTGVLAMEMSDGRERDGQLQALGRIIAAQLAASIAAPDVGDRRAAEA